MTLGMSRTTAIWICAAAVAAFGVWRAADLWWLCDDAFISFRYAENLVDGHGLVFNPAKPEERVEGYSNFLWVILVAAGVALGLEPEIVANGLGLGCFAGCLAVLAMASRSIWGRLGATPAACVGLALHGHAQQFATGGLETMGFTLLLTALAVRLVGAVRPAQFAVAGLLAALLAMTRPEGFGYVALGCFLAARSGGLRAALAYLAPVVAVALPWFVWRWSYYGYPLPNTFYAKSADQAWVGQGLYYAGLYFGAYWVLVPAVLLAPLAGLWSLGKRMSPELPPWEGLRPWLVVGGFVGANLVFVLWVGGDFMFARFFIPATPLLYLATELLLRSVSATLPTLARMAIVALGTLLSLVPSWLEAREQRRGIGDERSQYPPERVAENLRIGRELRPRFEGTDAKVVFMGSQAMIAYEARIPYAIEGVTGLTDPHLAHREIDERGQPGHEKPIWDDPDYLLEVRPDLVLEPRPGFQPFQYADLFGLPVTIMAWRPEIMGRFVGVDGVDLVDFPQWFDQRLRELQAEPLGARTPAAALQAEWFYYKLYYFDHCDDPARQRAFRALLRR